MSYLNFTFTVRPAAGAPPFQPTTSLDVGFSREGGRLDHLAHTSVDRGPLPPITRDVPASAPVVATAAALKDALLGAGTPASMVVERGDGGQPDLVTWTGVRGQGGGSGLVGALPTPIAEVLTAAQALEGAAAVALAAPAA